MTGLNPAQVVGRRRFLPGKHAEASPMPPGIHWEFLFQQTLRFATYQIRRLSWRGDPNGPLPEGYDANSLAAQAMLEFLQNSNLSLPVLAKDLDGIQCELNRLVLKHVTRLHHRKENFILCNAEDLRRVRIDDGGRVNPIELIPDPSPYTRPDQALLEKESIIQFHYLKQGFEDSLDGKPLKKLLELGCDDISKPQDVAARLKLGVRGIYNLRVRLQRAWRRFTAKPQDNCG